MSRLAAAVGPELVEAVLYQHLPVFHAEHCVFCRFLSQGTTYKDCGRPCQKHEVSLRDVQGAHPVLADVECRNTVFGAEAQEASRFLKGWREAGLFHFRLEFAHQSGRQVIAVTEAFSEALSGRMSYAQLSRTLHRLAPQGTTAGSYFVPADYLTPPVPS